MSHLTFKGGKRTVASVLAASFMAISFAPAAHAGDDPPWWWHITKWSIRYGVEQGLNACEREIFGPPPPPPPPVITPPTPPVKTPSPGSGPSDHLVPIMDDPMACDPNVSYP